MSGNCMTDGKCHYTKWRVWETEENDSSISSFFFTNPLSPMKADTILLSIQDIPVLKEGKKWSRKLTKDLGLLFVWHFSCQSPRTDQNSQQWTNLDTQLLERRRSSTLDYLFKALPCQGQNDCPFPRSVSIKWWVFNIFFKADFALYTFKYDILKGWAIHI